MAKVMQILLLIGSIGVFIFLAAACGGSVWQKLRSNDNFTTGLFRFCDIVSCRQFHNAPDHIEACRAFAIIAVLAAFAGIVFAILVLAVERIRGFIASIILFGAAGSMALALIIYAAETTDNTNSWDYGWSYIIGWIGVIGAIATGIFGFFAERC